LLMATLSFMNTSPFAMNDSSCPALSLISIDSGVLRSPLLMLTKSKEEVTLIRMSSNGRRKIPIE
jgi:hypothetical protein